MTSLWVLFTNKTKEKRVLKQVKSPFAVLSLKLVQFQQQLGTRTIKCTLIGDREVGKTAIAFALTAENFAGNSIPNEEEEYYSRNLMTSGKTVNVQICDTPGKN